MKKTILISTAVFALTVAHGQTTNYPAHTISYSVAWPPYPTTFSPIPKSKRNSDVVPMPSLNFNYINKRNIRLGISFGLYQAFSSDTFYVSPLKNPYDNIMIENYQILFNIDYVYVNKPKFNLYSGVAFGYCLTMRTGAHGGYDNGIKYQYMDYSHNRAWHFNFLGVNYFPVKWLGIFSEIGYGYGGIIKGGIIYRSQVKQVK